MTDKQLERTVERHANREGLARTRALRLIADYAVEYAGGKGLVTKKVTALAQQIQNELDSMASHARYSGQAFGLLTGEEPPTV